MYDINKTLENIKKDGLFKSDQLSVIEYAMYRTEITKEAMELIIDPTIPSDYMSMYVHLMIRGIDVKKYIKRNWALMEIPVPDLEKTIIAENSKLINLSKANITESDSLVNIKSAKVTEEKPKTLKRVFKNTIN